MPSASPKSPTKAELLARLQELERRYLPMEQETVNDLRNEPASMLPSLSAETVHAAIAAAEQGDTRDLFAVYRDVLLADTHLATVIETRILAVVGEDPDFQPADPKKNNDVAACNAIREAWDRLADPMGVLINLMWGTMWPLAMLERTYKPAEVPGLRYDWRDIVPVPDTLFRWTNGVLEIQEVSEKTRQLEGEWFRPEPSRYITHRGHLMRSPDCWGGPMRALVWWFFLGIMDREWWVRFLDKFGTPFMVGKFEKTDDRSRQILERAFKLSTKIGGLVVTQGTQMELLKTGTGDSAAAYQAFHEACNREKSKRVLGQTLSTEAQATGMNSGNASLHGQVRGDIRSFDAKRLNQTLRQQLFAPWLRLNGFSGRPPNVIFGAEEEEEIATTGQVIASLHGADLIVADEGLATLSKRVGLPIVRKQAPAAPESPLKKLSAPLPTVRDPAAAAQSISREAAAAIARSFGGSLAPVREILLAADGPDQAQARLEAAFSDWSPTKVAEVVETALVAGAWNGAQP
jgi:phage gp29-like protein